MHPNEVISVWLCLCLVHDVCVMCILFSLFFSLTSHLRVRVCPNLHLKPNPNPNLNPNPNPNPNLKPNPNLNPNPNPNPQSLTLTPPFHGLPYVR